METKSISKVKNMSNITTSHFNLINNIFYALYIQIRIIISWIFLNLV